MNFAVVGTNFISDRFVEAARRTEGACISAVYSRAKETADAFADRHGISGRFTDYGQMLKSPDIDAVYIASPTFLHAHHAALAMKAKKAVLCEKMICADEGEFLELKRIKDEENGLIIEAMRCDFDPMLSKVRELLPEIGRVKSAAFDFCQYSSRYDKFLEGTVLNAFDPSMKNSALADIGIYPLHFAVSVFGLPQRLTSKSVFLHNGFEGSGEISLGYEDFNARITYSKTVESRNISYIEGERGYIEIGRINEPEYVLFKSKDGSVRHTPPKGSSNMANEVAEFIRIAMTDKDEAERLFSITADVMRCVGEVYRQNRIFE